MRDAVKIAREAGRLDNPLALNEISLAIENERHSPGYKPSDESPYRIIRKAFDRLNDIAERRETEKVLQGIKNFYGRP